MKTEKIEMVANAFAAWLGGKTFSQIAGEIGVQTRTVAKWSKKHNWSQKKAQASMDAQRAIGEQFERELVECHRLLLSGLFACAKEFERHCLEKTWAAHTQLLDTSLLIQRLASAFGKINPRLSDAMADKLLGLDSSL